MTMKKKIIFIIVFVCSNVVYGLVNVNDNVYPTQETKQSNSTPKEVKKDENSSELLLRQKINIKDINKTKAKNKVETEASIRKKREKLHSIIRNFNQFSMGASNVYTYYERAFGVDATQYKKTVYTTTIELFQTIDKQDLVSAKEIDTLHELDGLIDAYIQKGMFLRNLYNEAHEYYEMKDYKKDKYAKGSKMHKSIIDAFHAFFNIDKTLHTRVEEIQDALDIAYFNRLKDQGHMIAYLKGMSLKKAKDFLKESRVAKIDKLDTVAIEKSLAALRVFYDKLYLLKKENNAQFTKASHFFSMLKKYVLTATEFALRVKEKRGYSKLERSEISTMAGGSVHGSVGQLIETYNHLIEAYNH